MIFTRTWAMPNGDTFDVLPIGNFVQRYLKLSVVSIDPFARNKQWATLTNDLNPETDAKHHMDAGEFLKFQQSVNTKVDLLIFDPPYSPRQMSECYKNIGRKVGMEDTQNAALYKRCKDAAMPLLTQSAVALSFGWNSAGMGKERGFEIIEILLVCHGAGHNDTICVAERRLPTLI